MRGSGKPKTPTNTTPQCELEVKSGTLGANGVYTSEVVVGFKSVTQTSDNVEIDKVSVGTSNSSRNKETYTITKKGKIKLYGYVVDKNGNTGTCEIEVEVNPTKPTCELEVKSGTLGQNDWYTTDIVVGFKSMDPNSDTAKIEKYYIEKKTTNLDNDEVIRAEAPKENIDKLTVSDNLTTELNGYVIDSNGTEGTCTITVKKDADLPTCKLKVVSGTQDSSGIYTSTVVVGMESATDGTSDIAAKGVGTAENYTQETFAVTAQGTTVVYGYVTDNAGNKGSCNISITRPTPPPPVTSNPTCSLKVIGSKSGDTYIGPVTVTFGSKSSTNGATITSYGIGTSAQLNGQESYAISADGTYKVYGMVRDSNGKNATCGPVTINIKTATPLAQKVTVGDFVAYDAGKWENSSPVPTTANNFGGYSANGSKNATVKCRADDTSTASGWRVLSISGNTVTIIHAGISECYYHSRTVKASESVAKLNERAKTNYMNSFAQDARMYNFNDYNGNKNLQVIGSNYYIATPTGESDAEQAKSTTLRYVSASGRLSGGSDRANGVRPVVVLKSNVTTNGKNENGAWTLVLDGNVSKDTDPILELPTTYMEQIKNKIDNINDTVKEFVENHKEQ